MNLDRTLIKSQAKQLIKGNVFKLFIIIFVVSLLTEGGVIYSSTISSFDKVGNFITSSADNNSDEKYGLNDADDYDFDDFENFNNSGSIDEFNLDDFTNQSGEQKSNDNSVVPGVLGGIRSKITSFGGIALLFLAPLSVSLAGLFYQIIKGKKYEWNEEFEFVFSKAFDKNYWNKFLLNLLQSIFTFLWSLLFVIPGIVYSYKVYFTFFIMAEKPELSWKEAIEISKKMTDGHKGELFVLDLSFIGWYFLEIITLGIVGIYLLPYQYTTKALYYENFKLRAIQLGQMSEFDFLTEAEKAAMAENGTAQAQVYQPIQENVYQPPVSPVYPEQNNIYQTAENPTTNMDEPETVIPPVVEEAAVETPAEAPTEKTPVEAPAGETDVTNNVFEEEKTEYPTPWEE
ncbi:MAG: DUF975 family protein [Eubacterium sp.]|nr:DUF975 family protein [Eubacterium sp.]